MAIYLVVLLDFLTHVGLAGSRLAVPLFSVDQGVTPFIVGTVVALYAAFPALLALPAGSSPTGSVSRSRCCWARAAYVPRCC